MSEPFLFNSKFKELIASRLTADSKAVSYFLEMEALSARLFARQREGEKLSREASTARLEEDRVRDEIAITKENYETQLSVMSEHLASMNSKLAEQEETIAQLRYEVAGVNVKAGKKGKK
jgi:protein phosphatase 1 regulatory subunit 21